MRSFAAVLSLIMVFSAAAGIKHPSLLFTHDRVDAARELMRTDTAMRNAWVMIKEEADRQLEEGNVRKLEYPSLAYLITGDSRYSDKIKTVLLRVSEEPGWGDREMLARTPAWRSELQMAHKAFQLALAYDAVYDCLSGPEKKKISDGLYRLAVEPLLGDWFNPETRIHSLNSMGHNWWSSCVGMGGLLGLAICNEIPGLEETVSEAVEALSEWFGFDGDVLQGKPKNFDCSGGMYESINYASFGITEALVLRLAWMNSHPGKKLREIPQMADIASFFCRVAYPRTGMLYSINFGDSHKNVTGESAMLLAYAMGYENPETLWYIEQLEPGQHREGYPLHFPMGFLYTPRGKKAPKEPSVSLCSVWPDFGWASMRDSWKKDATMLAVKSGMTWNHSHADANSFILFHKGTDIIKDAGNCSYGKPEYRNYFFQSDAHNVVKVNGEGQPTFQQYHGTLLPGSVSGLTDNGHMIYVLADGTGPMSDKLNRNFRHFLWIGNVIYILDDLSAHNPSSFEWLWHPGGKARKRGFDLEIESENGAVAIRPLFPRPLAYSNFVHDYPDDMYWETIEAPTEDLKGTEEYFSFKLPGIHQRVKALTAIMLKDSIEERSPLIERREGKDWIGLRVRDGQMVTDIYINQLADGRLMHMNSWIKADGWETDAYMLVVRYSEDKSADCPEDVFVCYGSSLKRDNTVLFSSLKKRNAMYPVSEQEKGLKNVIRISKN